MFSEDNDSGMNRGGLSSAALSFLSGFWVLDATCAACGDSKPECECSTLGGSSATLHADERYEAAGWDAAASRLSALAAAR